MSDTKTKDTGVSLTYINNNYMRSDGTTPVSGSIDMKGNTLYNVSNPVNPRDPATKTYVDKAIKNLAGGDVLVSKEGVFLKENGNYRATAPLDIDNNKIENLPEPLEDGDAANKKRR